MVEIHLAGVARILSAIFLVLLVLLIVEFLKLVCKP